MRLSLYHDGTSVAHRLDPRAKLGVLALYGGSLFWVNAHAVLLLPVAAVFLTAAVARVLRPFSLVALAVTVLGMVSFLFWPVLLAIRGQGSLAGWIYGSAMGLRLIALLLGGMLLLLVTRMEELLAAAGRLGVPYPVVFVLGLTMRLVPALLATATHVVEAQRLRGLRFDEGGPITRARRYLPLLLPILAGSLRGAHRMAWALEAKGFGGTTVRTTYLELRMRPADWAALAAAGAWFTLAVVAWHRGVGQLAVTGF